MSVGVYDRGAGRGFGDFGFCRLDAVKASLESLPASRLVQANGRSQIKWQDVFKYYLIITTYSSQVLELFRILICYYMAESSQY
jgi:hypothetical protein